MAAIFEAPASHEATHEASHEWEWEAHEWEHPEAHEWESHEWESPGAHEWEAHEWESPGAQEWESHEWEHPEAHEWEAHEWEHPEAHEWEAHEWEHPEAHEWEAHEWEADPFFGKAFKRLTRGLGSIAKRLAPGAIRALAGMIPGVGAIAGPILGQLTQRILAEAESLTAELESEAFGGSNGEAEVGHSETAHEAAMAELLAAEAAEAASEAEASSLIAATLPLSITIMRADPRLRRVAPVLAQGSYRLTRSFRRYGPPGRQLVRAIPTIQRRAIATIDAAARRGAPISSPLAVRALIAAAQTVLNDPRRVEIAVGRNLVLRRRTAPMTPRRAVEYRPRRYPPAHPRRTAASAPTYAPYRRYRY
ncbi:MAG: hypothetical protein QOF53_3234 [Nocardioidaceae bacterium]|jgi:hypothetical protein|nr:hypothetical protein [Nocardioidaceae bacterium]